MTPIDYSGLMQRTCDVYAERGIIGCWLHGAICDDMAPAWISDQRRRLLFLAADCLRAHGEWHVPSSDHPAHVLAAALANAERVAHAVIKTELWDGPDDPRAELKRCLDGATMPGLLDYYVGRVRDCHQRRIEITTAEHRLRTLMQEVA